MVIYLPSKYTTHLMCVCVYIGEGSWCKNLSNVDGWMVNVLNDTYKYKRAGIHIYDDKSFLVASITLRWYNMGTNTLTTVRLYILNECIHRKCWRTATAYMLMILFFVHGWNWHWNWFNSNGKNHGHRIKINSSFCLLFFFFFFQRFDVIFLVKKLIWSCWKLIIRTILRCSIHVSFVTKEYFNLLLIVAQIQRLTHKHSNTRLFLLFHHSFDRIVLNISSLLIDSHLQEYHLLEFLEWNRIKKKTNNVRCVDTLDQY